MKRKIPNPSTRGLLALAALVLATAPTLCAQETGRPQRRGWLGFAFDSVGPVVVRRIELGSPAQRAGLQVGDTIVTLNGRPVTAASLLNERLEPGDTVRLGLRRRGLAQQLVLVAEPRRFPRSTSVVALSDSIIVTVTGDSVRRVIRIHLDSMLAHLDKADLPFVRVDEEDPSEPSTYAQPWSVTVFQYPSSAIVRRLVPGDSIGQVITRAYSVTPLMPTQPPPPPPTEPPPPPPTEPPPPPPSPVEGIWVIGRYSVAGAEFTELNPGLARYFDGAKEGILVLRVSPGTPAEKAGLRPGDVVVAIDGRRVRDVGELRWAVTWAGGKEIRLEVVREGDEKELTMAVPTPFTRWSAYQGRRLPER